MAQEEGSAGELKRKNDKRRRAWAKRAGNYDRSIGFFESRVFGRSHRRWACSHAESETLEVAIGTGLNIPLYDPSVRLTGIDLSREMLTIAEERAAASGRALDLREGDAHALPFDPASFDSVICTYSLCNVADPGLVLTEMARVLRPGGRLILVDHIRSSSRPIFLAQKAIEFFTARLEGEYMTRRPLEIVETQDLVVAERQRMARGGIVERVLASKPV